MSSFFSVQDERVPGREQAAEAEHENGAESAQCRLIATGAGDEYQPDQLILNILFCYSSIRILCSTVSSQVREIIGNKLYSVIKHCI
jgi:hypothetical protein